MAQANVTWISNQADVRFYRLTVQGPCGVWFGDYPVQLYFNYITCKTDECYTIGIIQIIEHMINGRCSTSESRYSFSPLNDTNLCLIEYWSNYTTLKCHNTENVTLNVQIISQKLFFDYPQIFGTKLKRGSPAGRWAIPHPDRMFGSSRTDFRSCRQFWASVFPGSSFT